MLILIIFIFVFGLIVGSFLNCFIWRLHTGESLGGRSYCPKCQKPIKWYDNIPVLSFCWLLGRCRNCGKPISWQYPIIELSTAILFILVLIKNFSFTDWQSVISYLNVFYGWFIVCVMLIIFVYDLRWYLILDKITLPAMAVILALNAILALLAGNGFNNLFWLLISGIIGGSFFLIQFLISKGRWIGGGDIRLGFLMGFALGWPYILEAIFLAYLMGSVVGLSLIITGKKQWGSKVPFGTFLAVATVVALLCGQEILKWYWGIFS